MSKIHFRRTREISIRYCRIVYYLLKGSVVSVFTIKKFGYSFYDIIEAAFGGGIKLKRRSPMIVNPKANTNVACGEI